MKTFFTSDLHVQHANIIKYCNRPFASVDDMNQALIRNWNSVIGYEDLTYVLGDFAFSHNPKNYLDQLNGKKILIKGNHDKNPKLSDGWDAIHDYLEIYVEKQFIVLSHYAMRVWHKSHRNSWQLYGHSHGSLPDDPNALSIDVGVDCHNYTPLSFEDIKRIMAKKDYKPIDHHGRKEL